MRKPWQEKKQKEKENNIKAIQDYEDNLKLHYESKRKELDLLLSSSLPHQISNIKMILWINFLFLGLSVAILKSLQFHWVYLISYGLSFLAIASMLIALTQRRTKKYGGIDQIDYVDEEVEDGVYAKSWMLSNLLKSAYDAVEHNRDTLQVISKYLRFSIITSFISLVLFFLFIIILNFNTGINIENPLIPSKEKVVIIDKVDTLEGKKNMAEKEKRPKPSEMNPPQRPIHEAEERDFKPAPNPPPKEKKEK